MHHPKLTLAALGMALAALSRAQTPTVEITSVPAYGADPGTLSGRVVGVNPAAYRVAALTFISGLGFYSKPYCNATTTPLAPDGSFNILMTTGTGDPYATFLAAVVVPASATVPCYTGEPGIPLPLEQQAVAEILVPRPNPNQREIQFAGETWVVRLSSLPVGPGWPQHPNYFSDSTDNVWVDASGRLHLRITYRNGKWYCAEIYSKRVIGYGRYSLQFDSVPRLDQNVVFGAYSWAEAERVSREVDMLELGRFGNAADPNNAQNVVQPWDTPGNQMRFPLPEIAPTIHSMRWEKNGLYFRSSDAQGGLLHEWTYSGQPPVPDSPRLNFRLNLWLVAPPSDGTEVEVVVSAFSFTPQGPHAYVPVTPCRVADTRDATAKAGFIRTREFPVAGTCGIPAEAAAYALNVTVIPRTASLGVLALWPAGEPQPPVSTLNSYDGRVKAGAAIVPAGTNGVVSVYVSDPADVFLDVAGYFVPAAAAPAALAYYPVAPCRAADTRAATAKAGFIGAQTIALTGVCGLPADAQAYAVNFTAIPRTSSFSFLSAWPDGQPQPPVSTLNAFTGAVTANAAIVQAGTGGAIAVYHTDPADLIVDVNGYFAPPGAGGLWFYVMTPCRAVDTRTDTNKLGFSGTRDFSMPASACGLPPASAYSLNATVLPRPQLDFLSLWDTGGAQPPVSTLNSFDRSVVSNAAIVPASAAGSITAYHTQEADLLLDVNGYFAP